jgi:F-type H+-transporting ATPase subunit epsilon
MAAKFHLQIVSPAQSVIDAEVNLVEIPGAEGDFGVLAGHAPLISMIRPGVITIYQDSKKTRLFVTSGYAEVSPDNVTVLSDDIHDIDNITAEQAREVLENAERDVSHAESDSDKAKAMKKVDAAKALVLATAA